MSSLRMVTRSSEIRSQVFRETFISIAEDQSDVPIAMLHEPALMLTVNSDEEALQENEDLQNMAVFMLLSGSMLGVKWGDKFYFGDVDLMDSEFGFDEDAKNVTLLQYELEDANENDN